MAALPAAGGSPGSFAKNVFLVATVQNALKSFAFVPKKLHPGANNFGPAAMGKNWHCTFKTRWQTKKMHQG